VKDLNEDIRNAFKDAASTRLKAFHEISADESRNGIIIFSERRLPTLWFFIAVIKSSLPGEFTLEIAWNQDASYPVRLRPTILPSNGGLLHPQVLANPSFRQRISRFWGKRKDHWWGVSPRNSASVLLSQMEAMARSLEIDPSTSFDQTIEQNAPPSSSVKLLVRDAMDRIIEFVLPYFDAVSAARSSR
jgi:hypothetical protein